MECILFCGIPGVGKSTFYQQRFLHSHVRLNLDMLHTRNRETILLHACLAAQQPFVVDNTNVTTQGRARYIRLAKAVGYRVVLYYFESKASDALARNANRPEPHRVPDKAIFGMLGKLQIPRQIEGYDAMYHVRIGPDGQFVVDDWREEAI